MLMFYIAMRENEIQRVASCSGFICLPVHTYIYIYIYIYTIYSIYISTVYIQVHLNKLECRGKVHLFQ